MKRTIITMLIILLISTGTIWAQGQGEAVSTEPVISATAAGNPNAPIKLRGLIGSWNTMASTVEARKAFYQRQLEAWAANHPDVYVEIELIPGGQTAQAMTKLINSALAGNPYDFANIDSQWVGNFHEAGILSSIDAYVSDLEKNQFFDFTKAVTQREGKQYGFWAETGILLYYYNTEIVDTPPETWDDVYALARKMRAEGSDVTPFLTQGKGAAAAFNLLPDFWAAGGMLFDPEDDYRPVFGEGKNREAMKKSLMNYRKLLDDGVTVPEIVGYQHVELQSEAQAGNVATMIAGSWVYNALDPNVWAYTSLPSYDADSKSNITGGWTFGFMSTDEQKLKEAVSFVQEVYTSAPAMAERLPLHGYIPTRKDVFEADAFQTPFYKQIKAELETSGARPATSLYPDVESLIEEAVGKLVSGEKDIDKLIDQMYSKVMAKYEDM